MLWLEVTQMYRTILFAVEDDESLPAAIGAVAAYASFWRAQVRVLHVNRIDPASPNGAGRGLVEAVVERLRAEGVDVEGETRSVKTDDEIPGVVSAVATRVQPDLLVVGSRGRSGVAGFVLGSVSHRIAAGVDVPVLVIRASHTALRAPMWFREMLELTEIATPTAWRSPTPAADSWGLSPRRTSSSSCCASGWRHSAPSRTEKRKAARGYAHAI
jgi:nucleotide-binding universal stress UspA family protein